MNKAPASALERLSIDAIRTLSMDAVQQANSGHPGTPMALAPIAYELWANWLRYDPTQPHWPGRDRFVLSCGHASMLLYSVLHLAGVKRANGDSRDAVEIADIQRFRQWHSPCAGHPEFGEVTGAETTTGPLGQGVANSVGMALASRWLSAHYSSGELNDYRVYTLCSDGDLMEGIASEAASLAGHWGLGNLCWIYDDNRITIEGATDLAFSENISAKFAALGWQTLTVDDANDLPALRRALQQFQAVTDRPTLISVRSIIGYGAPTKQNTAAAHGAPLGDAEIAAAKAFYEWPHDRFHVPSEVREHFQQTLGKRGSAAHGAWQSAWQSFQKSHPAAAAELQAIWDHRVPAEVLERLSMKTLSGKPAATRAWSGKALNQVAELLPWFVGGSADLAESNKSLIEDPAAGHFSRENYAGRNFHFGIRELAMAAISNGMALSGLRSYCATFFVFTDYLRPALRLSALMKLPVLYVLTHDSIGLGEDGPTHQPVEHLAACRAIPNLLVIRPADSRETSEAYRVALSQTQRPTALVLSRQTVPELERRGGNEGVAHGAYVFWEAAADCDILLLGTGSELSLCWEAAQELVRRGRRPRVVSFPCWELFEEQAQEYRDHVLPPGCRARVAVEAGLAWGWERYLGPQGKFVGMRSFGASAPAEVLYEKFGLTVSQIVAAAEAAG